MDLSSQMILFAQVVDSGSFSAAARTLNQSTSALSRQISLLEDQLAVRLLVRTGRGISTTEEGNVFYQRCQSVASEVTLARQLLAEMTDHPTGRLRIACTVAFGKAQFLPILPRFLGANPDVNVSLTLTDQKVNLGDGEFDIAVRFSEQISDQTAILRKLATNRRVLVAAPSYLANRSAPEVMSDLVHHDCLRLSAISQWNDWIPPKTPVTFEANSADGVYHATCAGLGIARISTFLVNNDIANGRLVRVLPDYVQEDSAVALSYAAKTNLSRKTRAFIDFMVDAFGPTPPWERQEITPKSLVG